MAVVVVVVVVIAFVFQVIIVIQSSLTRDQNCAALKDKDSNSIYLYHPSAKGRKWQKVNFIGN